ncbi:peptidoglycan bridge formation glycyltransferase FemA/FemB family protein [Candidatus Peregrinibacteria bacterium]|nr:peptidoglycan bridge formation glycyltransferase FemA/FemB family protein [Candidatus Peregrinibacteria bacterium]
MTIKPLTKEFEKSWSKYLLHNSDASIYHTLKWRDILIKEYNFKHKYLIALNSNDNIIGVFPIFLIKNLTGSKLISLPCSQWGGCIVDNENIVEKFLNYIISKKNEWGYKKAVIKFNKHLKKDYPNFQKQNEQLLCSVNTSLSFDDLKKSFSRNKKRNYKKCKDAGIKVFDCTNHKDLKNIYELEVNLRKRQGVPIPSYKYFKLLLDTFSKEKNIKIMGAKDKNSNLLAAELFFTFKNNAVNGYSVTQSKSNNKLSPITMVQWEEIKHCTISNKIHTLYFGSTDKNASGILKYKQKWGTSCKEISNLYYPKSGIVTSISKKGKIYSLFLFTQKLIPKFIFKRIGKYTIKYLT